MCGADLFSFRRIVHAPDSADQYGASRRHGRCGLKRGLMSPVTNHSEPGRIAMQANEVPGSRAAVRAAQRSFALALVGDGAVEAPRGTASSSTPTKGAFP
jgi:hypothetical protein